MTTWSFTQRGHGNPERTAATELSPNIPEQEAVDRSQRIQTEGMALPSLAPRQQLEQIVISLGSNPRTQDRPTTLRVRLPREFIGSVISVGHGEQVLWNNHRFVRALCWVRERC